MRKWIDFDLSGYDLPEDINSGDWHWLFNDLKEAYARWRGWDEDLWDEDGDKAYEAEYEAYMVIGDLRVERGY